MRYCVRCGSEETCAVAHVGVSEPGVWTLTGAPVVRCTECGYEASMPPARVDTAPPRTPLFATLRPRVTSPGRAVAARP